MWKLKEPFVLHARWLVRLTLQLVLFASASSSFLAQASKSALTVRGASSLAITAMQGGEPARTHPVIVHNSGNGALEWSISSNQHWLEFQPSSGIIAPNADAAIALTANLEGLSPGIYEAEAQVMNRQV